MIDIPISYTFLSTYKRCHRRAKLQYVDKVIPRDKVDHRPFIVGICADQLFNKWVKQGYETDWMEGKAEGWFKWFAGKVLVRYRDFEDKDKLIRKLRISVNRLQDAAFAENLPERKIVVQRSDSFKLDGIEFKGKLDIWFPDEKAIWDLKITQSFRYLDSFQLYFFAWLLKNCGDETEKLAFLAPLMKQHLKEVDWTVSILHSFEEELWQLIELIKTEHWEITAKDCWGCPVQRWCEEPSDSYSKVQKTKVGGVRFDL